jgi:hypothetical protein
VILYFCEFPDDLVEFVLELSDDCRAFLVLLRRIDISSSIEVISSSEFLMCTSLMEVLFTRDGNLKHIEGLQKCT